MTQANGSTYTFDCRATDAGTELLSDGGFSLGSAVCSPTGLTLTGAGNFTLTVTSTQGRSFSGSVSPTYQDTGNEVCGSRCRTATETVTVR